MGIIQIADGLMKHFFEIGVIILELFGAIVLIYTGVRCFIKWIRRNQKVKLDLANGIALALEFKLGGEILKSAVVQDWKELGILGAVIVLRLLMTLVIHWEIAHDGGASADD